MRKNQNHSQKQPSQRPADLIRSLTDEELARVDGGGDIRICRSTAGGTDSKRG